MCILLIFTGCGKGDSGLTFDESSVTYTLENPPDDQILHTLSSITLYDDGKASFEARYAATYLFPYCTYSIQEGEMFFYADIPAEEANMWVSLFNLQDGDFVAKFVLIDENALVLSETSLPDVGFGVKYVTDNPTHRDLSKTYKVENQLDKRPHILSSIVLYDSGKATFKTSQFLPFMLPTCTYSIQDGEILLFADIPEIEADSWDSLFSLHNDDLLVKFILPNENTLVLSEVSFSTLYLAGIGEKYVATQQDN